MFFFSLSGLYKLKCIQLFTNTVQLELIYFGNFHNVILIQEIRTHLMNKYFIMPVYFQAYIWER